MYKPLYLQEMSTQVVEESQPRRHLIERFLLLLFWKLLRVLLDQNPLEFVLKAINSYRKKRN